MNDLPSERPIIVAIAGPNGAGKSTFYKAFFEEAGLPFVNADLIARELNVVDSYEAALQAKGGVPKQIADLLVVSEVLEKRVLKTYTAHLDSSDFPAAVQDTLRKIVREMEEEEDGDHAGWIDRRLQLLPHEEVERAETKWKAIDAEVEASLKHELETNYPTTEVTK